MHKGDDTTNNEQKLEELRAELDSLAAEAGVRKWNIALEIVIEGQERGRFVLIRPHWVPPEVWKPESKLRRIYAEIVELRKKMPCT